MRKIGLISLGCDKNRVDSELLLGSAVDNDFEIVVDPMQADVLVVNTCAFIESARREAIEAIFDLVNVKMQRVQSSLLPVALLNVIRKRFIMKFLKLTQ